MQKYIFSLVKDILANEFQLDPEAFELIRNNKDETSVKTLIRNIIENKLKKGLDKRITVEDLVILSPVSIKKNKPESVSVRARLEFLPLQNKHSEVLEGRGGFESLFRSRYLGLMNIIKSRPDFFRIEKISMILSNKRKGRRKVSGLVMNKKMRRNNIILTIDDETGILELLAFDRKIMEEVKQLPLDSLVILDIEFSGKNIAIIKDVNMPDLPEHMPTYADEEVYAIFTSDLHIGSMNFLSEDFGDFISWLNKTNDKIVEKVRYLVIAGDNIDGIGVYPGQEADLLVHSISKQYDILFGWLQRIPRSIDIIIIPGNHDPVRQALPQPKVPRKYAESLYGLDNVSIFANPAWIKLHNVSVLVYHGRSLDDVMATTPGITFNRPALAMKTLLRARHLAPIYGQRTSTLPISEDDLIIKNVPDIFHAGHIHTLDSEFYRGTLMLDSGCWQSQTPFQAKMGIVPTPGIVPIVNLSNYEVVTKSFRRDDINLTQNN